MSGVGLTGKTVPLNGGAFPVFEDIYGQGGYRVVADIAERDAIPNNSRKWLMLVAVQSTSCVYQLGADLATWSIYTSDAKALGTQAIWWVDLVTGDDNNDGKTQATSLRTVEELSARLCPGNRHIVLRQNTTVKVGYGAVGSTPSVPQTQGALQLNIGWPATTGLFGLEFLVDCAEAFGAPMVLSAVTQDNPATNLRGELTTLAGTFVAQGQIKVIAGGAAVGSRGFSTGLHANAQNTYCTHFNNYELSSNPFPAVGDTVVMVTKLVTMTSTVIRQTQRGYFTLQGAACNFLHFDCAGKGGGQTGGLAWATSCDLLNGFIGESTIGGGLSLCRALGTNNIRGGDWFMSGMSWQGIFYVGQSTTFQLDNSWGVVDGGSVRIGATTSSNLYGSVAFRCASSLECCNGGNTQTAFWIGPQSNMQLGVPIWSGANAGVFAIGVLIVSGGMLIGVPSFASTINIQITGHNITWAQMPISYPRALCGAVVNPDPTCVAQTT
jgi:hypothetical protein